MLTDADLYVRGSDTLVASWEEYARIVRGAVVHRLQGVAVAVFTGGPERAVYNNALLARDLPAGERADALDVMESVYARAGVSRFAAWVHESDELMRREIERRDYAVDTSTRAMGVALVDARLSRAEIELGPPDWVEHLRIVGVPPGFLSGAERFAFHVLNARVGGQYVATAIAFDVRGDRPVTAHHHRIHILGQPAAEHSPARVHGLLDDCMSSLSDGGHLSPKRRGQRWFRPACSSQMGAHVTEAVRTWREHQRDPASARA
jgi:hypothetical protein